MTGSDVEGPHGDRFAKLVHERLCATSRVLLVQVVLGVPHDGNFFLESLECLLVGEGDGLVQDFDSYFFASALSTDDFTERTTANDFKAMNLFGSNLWRSLRNILWVGKWG